MNFFLPVKIITYLVICLSFISNSYAEVKPIFKQSFSLAGLVSKPSDIDFNPDGSKVFFTAFGNDRIHQFKLTTPFDISTIDSSQTEVKSSIIADPQGFAFNSTGTKVFIKNNGAGLRSYTLATPYELSGATADDSYTGTWNNELEPTGGAYSSHDIEFNNDGTKMYFFHNGGGDPARDERVIQYTLSTPYDPSSRTSVDVFQLGNRTSEIPQDIEFDDDGTRMYIIESHTGVRTTEIDVYKLTTGFDVTTASYVGSITNFFNAAGGNGTPLGLGFSSDGMKLYQVTYSNASGQTALDIAYEYDLTCPYGIVICETDAVTAIGAQVEIAKNVIYQNSSTIFKRFDWLRRNDERANLTNHEVKLNIHNPILAALKTNLENSLNNIEYTQASLKKENSKINKKNWSYWSHGDISFGRVGDTASSKPKEVKTRGIMFGADKLVDKKIFGYAFRYGNDEVDIDDGSSDELDAQTFSLNIYSSVPLKNRSNLNLLFGASYLMIDQLGKDQVTGNRNGKQIYTSMSYENENEYTKYQLIPFAKLEMGITQFSDYTDFGVVSNSVESHERLTFKTGNISAGLKFDDILYLNDDTISRNGFIEYIYDLTPNIDHYVKNHLDNTTLKKNINTHSLHNVKGNIGFEYMYSDGRTIAINYERFQSLDKSGHKDSLLIKFGSIKNHNANFDVIYDPINNNNTKVSYLKKLGNFNLKLNSNYSLFSKIPDYGANIEISGTF